MNNYTYILSLSDNTYYIGYTNDLNKRLKMHNEGKGAKRTRGRKAEIAYYEISKTKEEAMIKEYQWKKLTHKEKEQIIEEKKFTILSSEDI